jgi:hypothetical protein
MSGRVSRRYSRGGKSRRTKERAPRIARSHPKGMNAMAGSLDAVELH